MALTDIKCKKSKVPAGKKQIKLADSDNMYLLVTLKSKYWRLDYTYNGRRKTLALGVYPKVSLKEARQKKDAARKQLDDGEDPVLLKKKNGPVDCPTFKEVATKWHQKKSNELSDEYAAKIWRRLEMYVFPVIGSYPIAQVDSPMVLEMLEKIEKQSYIETMHKVKSLCSRVFRFAVVKYGKKHGIEYDPTTNLIDALTARKSKKMATIIEPKQIGQLLRVIEGYEGTFVVTCALRMAPYLFVRPGELRHAEWSEFDLDAGMWSIPGQKMKMDDRHLVPLAEQVIIVLRKLHVVTGHCKYVFPGIRTKDRPMSENTVNAALRRLGYEKDEICGHGFRAMASTRLHEEGWPSDVIERQLAHLERNQVKAAYNYAEHLEERKTMMQFWADYLDKLRDTPS
ncbi:tyrosine-type recombinase/integrase [Mariprofundus sp. NF]|uniref:tyrosine-type recombinase/integrase n=1 Tax=Mariprofundus sp. NF TaxID=2608716 RepID=UPI0015A457AB|nr:integrase arm-type DNA-binding domain-containing protein [Mariprofundus sp. NF]NWF38541.1 tyrosine-type recombinase/integrase [Mariprofundus sp. NF]